MKKQKLPAREPVQLHIDPTPAETTPEYTLEDIMNEFGGWTKREPEPAAASPEPEPPKPEKPEETPTPETSETPEAAPQEAEAVRPAESEWWKYPLFPTATYAASEEWASPSWSGSRCLF